MSPHPAVTVERLRPRNTHSAQLGPVVYWMQRDQRVVDNWALHYALLKANERRVPLAVVFNLVTKFGDTTHRHYDFMLRGLAEVATELEARGIPFVLLEGEPSTTIPKFVTTHQVGEVVVDQNPLRFTNAWREDVAATLSIPLTEVDAHNIVPVWVASDKQEFAAHTFRPKIHRHLSQWLTAIPALPALLVPWSARPAAVVDWEKVAEERKGDTTVPPVSWLSPGTRAGMQRLQQFLTDGDGYAEKRNDPNESALSHLSPYLHFGQISAQRVAKEVTESDLPKSDKESYLEELIVRRELSDNYCFYNPDYDTLKGAHPWAQQTLAEHRGDPREYIYTAAQLEAADTHDALWNAMQRQMVVEGKMHGWCRMYWAKKILEWTNTPEYAIKVALYLNDRYELDGTDPNGIVGIMWSIAGVHDRAWTERPIFGKIRYMNFNGAKRKFDVAAYIARYDSVPTLFT